MTNYPHINYTVSLIIAKVIEYMAVVLLIGAIGAMYTVPSLAPSDVLGYAMVIVIAIWLWSIGVYLTHRAVTRYHWRDMDELPWRIK